MKLMIFAATNNSLFALGVLEASVKEGYEVTGVVVRDTFSIDRFKEELAFGIEHFFKKLIRQIHQRIFSDQSHKSGWAAYLDERRIKVRSISACCEEYGIPLLSSSNINDEKVLNFMDKIAPDLVVFGGGGIVRERILSKASVLNCHMGLLPKYRGNYPWIWALANKDFNQIGLSIHFMEARLDQGPIIKNFPLDLSKCISLHQLVIKLEYQMIPSILTVLSLLKKYASEKSEVPTITQEQADGQQYYIPHKKIMWLAENIFKKFKRDKNVC